MCGIIGIVGKDQVADRLVDGLRRMEYRGYDSAGICLVADGQLVRRRAEGKLNNLVLELVRHPAKGMIGIAHTRWATHGAASTINAHTPARDDGHYPIPTRNRRSTERITSPIRHQPQ